MHDLLQCDFDAVCRSVRFREPSVARISRCPSVVKALALDVHAVAPPVVGHTRLLPRRPLLTMDQISAAALDATDALRPEQPQRFDPL